MDSLDLTPSQIVGVTAADHSINKDADEASESPGFLDSPATVRKGDMPYRSLGRTGEMVSLIGVGGFHIGMPKEEALSIRIIRTAVDSGINFMDNCWDYHNGLSEIRMGKALRDGYREKVFLMTKIDGRDKATAAKQIDESLLRLQTDHVDLLQLHEIIRLEDPDRVFAQEGAMEALLSARQAGKTRFIGFTGHKDPMVHHRMLDMADNKGIVFDTVQMPLNVMDAHFRSFQHTVLPRLVKDKIGVLGMKALGAGAILNSKVVSPVECLHYAMTLPTSVVITGMESLWLLDQALTAARSFVPLNPDQQKELLDRTCAPAREGKYELFKTATMFDATARNIHWLGDVQP